MKIKLNGAGFGAWAVVVGVAFLGCPARMAYAAEEKPAVPDAETKGRVEKSIRELGAADPAAREAATQELVRIGAPAAEAVYRASKSGDAEVALRAEQVLARLKWASPEVKEKLQALRKARDSKTWDRLWGELLDLGDAARAALEQEMATPDGELKLDVEAPKRSARGSSFSCQVRLRNEGKTGIWIDRTVLQVKPGALEKWSVGKAPAADNPMMPNIARLQRLAMRGIGGAPAADEEARYVYLAPGESSTHKVDLDEQEEFDFAGRARARVEYLGGDPAGRKTNPMEMAFRAQPAQGASPVKIACLKKDVSGESDWVELVPDLTRAPAELSLAYAEGAKPVPAADGIPVRLILQNEGKEPVFFLSGNGKDQPGFWFVLQDGKGDVVQFGRLGQPAGEGKGTDLPPSGKIEVEGRIVPSVPPGTYKLVCGFSGHGVDPAAAFGGVRIQMPVRAGRGVRGGAVMEPPRKEWSGDALTPPAEVVIPGGAK